MIDFQNPEFEFVTEQSRLNDVALILENQSIIAVDTEANSLDPYLLKLLLVQFPEAKNSPEW